MNRIDKIYVINLERRKDRLDNFKKELSKKSDINFDDITVFKAIDGKQLAPTKQLKTLTNGNDYGYRSGVIGVALSHYDLWREIMGQHYIKRAVIFEDDVELAENFTDKWNNLAKNIPDDCHLLLLNPANYRKADKSKFVKVNNYFTKQFDSGYGAYSYMITPNMARKYVEYIEKNGLYRSIDGMMMDIFRIKRHWLELTDHTIDGLSGYRLIYPITFSKLEFDSDIQNQTDSILHHPVSKKRIIKIAWINWWRDFNPNENFFYHFIEKQFNRLPISVELEDEPDLVMCSVFGDFRTPPKVDKGKTKTVIFTGEYYSVHNLGYDLSIGFDHEEDVKDDNYIRVPLWLLYLDWFNLRGKNELPLSYLKRDGVTLERDKFCLFVSSNPRCKERNTIFSILNNAKRVDSGGKLAKNIDIPGDKEDIGHLLTRNRFEMKYRFSLSCENRSKPGYCTEKMLLPFLAGSIPIYWGDPTVEIDFNPEAFINLNGVDQKDIVNKVMEIENNPERWRKMASTPALKEGVLQNYYNKLRSRFEKLLE